MTLQLPAQQPPNFKSEEAAGIYTYDIDKVIKKLKIEDAETQQSIYAPVHAFNASMDQLSVTHAQTFNDLDAKFSSQVKIAMQRRDRSVMDGVKTEIKQTIPPIRKEVMMHEAQLNTSMESVLDEKQYKKWLSYQKSQRPPVPSQM